MNGRNAKKIRKELARLRRQLVGEERQKISADFKKFVNSLSWWNRLKLCREIMRRRF